MERVKTCTKCGQEKPLGDYGRDRRKEDGYRRECKECKNAQKRAYREANREQINAQKRAYREANREQINAQQSAYREANREQIKARQRTYVEANREQIKARKRTYREAQNAATRIAATRNNAPWTPEEDAYLLTTTDTSTVAALNLGRTHDSVMRHRSKLSNQSQKDTAA